MRIAIVNDLALAAEAIRRALAADGRHQVAWVARDGAEAIDKCRQDTPDLVLMDMVMPGVDGVQATRQIMADTPCPILIVTASVDANSAAVFEAMGAGALDVVRTPGPRPTGAPEGPGALLAKINTIAKLVAGAPAARAASKPAGQQLVAIGASAGGPAALAELLAGLPREFPAAVVIIQHVDEQFAPGLAEWLHRQSALPVRLAQEGEPPLPGAALLAGKDAHLTLTASGALSYTPLPEHLSCRPSVDVFFASAARRWPGQMAGVLLTGMGRDGARGLRMMREAGAHTIAQDRSTSAVYGMPKAADELGAAVEVLPLRRIAPTLAAIFSRAKP